MGVPKLKPNYNGDEQNQSDDTTKDPKEELYLPTNEYIKIKKEITSLLNQNAENIKGKFKSEIDKETATIQEIIKQNTENIRENFKIEISREMTHINETIEQNIDNTKKDFKTEIGKVVGKLNFLIICCVVSIVLSASVSITLSFKILSDKKIREGRGPDSIEKPVIPPGNSTKEKKAECIDKIKLQEYVKDQPVCK